LSHDLKVERVLEASPEDVFDAFTDPDAHKKMYAYAPDWIVESECDLRVGGKWSISFGSSGGVSARETNVFQMVDRPRRLVYLSTMMMPDGTSFNTTMEVLFGRDDSGTG
jgi:uncharacterized protein YndB with AHSA1/START domain